MRAISSSERSAGLQFARRLKEQRLARGMSQSDLAREIFGEYKDPSTGYVVAKSRDRISVWENGKELPSETHLQMVADALGVDQDVLAPEIRQARMSHIEAPVGMAMVKGKPDRAVLTANVVASIDLVAKIMALIAADPIAKASIGSSMGAVQNDIREAKVRHFPKAAAKAASKAKSRK